MPATNGNRWTWHWLKHNVTFVVTVELNMNLSELNLVQPSHLYREKHIEGLMEIEALAQDHSTILKENLQQVCVKINSEVMNNAFLRLISFYIFEDA